MPSSSSELPLPVSLNNSQPHTSQSQPPNFRRANTAGARIQSSARKGKQSSTKKGTKKRSRSLPDPSLPSVKKWLRPIHSHTDTQQLNGGSQTVGGQAAHHSSPLRPTHPSSSSSGIFSGGTEEVTSALLSEPGKWALVLCVVLQLVMLMVMLMRSICYCDSEKNSGYSQV